MKALLVLVGLCLVYGTYAQLRAGAAKVNGTLPVGTPLAGYNHGTRRVPYWPLPSPKKYTTWMEPSTGNLDPTWVKCVIIDTGDDQIAFVTSDTIGSDGSMGDAAYLKAVEMGFTLSRDQVIFSGSHTHSGPGAISPEFLWSIAPATDLVVPELFEQLSISFATAMVDAQHNMQPAVMNIGVSQLTGVTQNRRAPNPWVQPDTIDPHLGVIRIDSASTSEPIATIWNYAMHGTCYGPGNMKFSSDIMGHSCQYIEDKIGGVALFLNADAGDIDPTDKTCGCTKNVCQFPGAAVIGGAVVSTRNSLTPTNQVALKHFSQIVPFGLTNINFTLARFDNCTKGGDLDICALCVVLKCDLPIALGESWVEQNPRFSAVSWEIEGERTVMVTMPGEPLIELGWMIRNDTEALGFDNTFLMGYSNSHMGYFATPNEYDWGGYESQLTFWGINTAEKVREGVKSVATQV